VAAAGAAAGGCCGDCCAESQASRAAMGLMRPASGVRKSPVWYF